MFQQFVNRDSELTTLNDMYRKERASFLVIYGRRRIGKTELVKQFINNKSHVYFLADDRGDRQNIKEFQKEMTGIIDDTLFGKVEFDDWVELFDEFSKRAKTKLVIVVDEFPYLIHNNKAIPSIWQKIWDTILYKSNVFLIILGSSIGMMEEQVLSYRSPLYGRRTGQIKLTPLRFKHLTKFFPDYSLEELIKVYGVCDGIPAYLQQFDPELNFTDNLINNILNPMTFLNLEAEFLLKQELREKAHYFNILSSVALGRAKFGEIVNLTGLDKTLVSKYLSTLILLHIIEKEFPVTQKKPTKNARYIFSDNYYDFWFRFIYPNKTMIELGKTKEIVKEMQEDMTRYFAYVFEKVCKEYVLENPSFPFNKVGRWWHKDVEIDIVALNERQRQILFGECKFSDRVDANKLLQKLIKKTDAVDWKRNDRHKRYVLFAKSFKKKAGFEDERTTLVDLNDMNEALKTSGING